MLMRPPLKRSPAGAPGCHAAGSGVATDAADWFRPVVHCPVLPHVLRPGLRVCRADREADGVRHAGRRGPGALVLRPGPVESDDLGVAVARLVVALLVPAGQPVTAAVDDTLFRRRGKKVWAASWFHDGPAPGSAKTGYGNNWVIAAIVCWLPFCSRPVAIPVLARLVIKGTTSASRLWLAHRMAQLLAGRCPAAISVSWPLPPMPGTS